MSELYPILIKSQWGDQLSSSKHMNPIRNTHQGAPNVQQILKDCRDKYHGSGSDNPNAKHWVITNIITGNVDYVDDLRGFCLAHQINYNSLYFTLKNKKPYRKIWLLESLDN